MDQDRVTRPRVDYSDDDVKKSKNPLLSLTHYSDAIWLTDHQLFKFLLESVAQLDSTSNRHNHPKYRYSTRPRVEYRTTIRPTIGP